MIKRIALGAAALAAVATLSTTGLANASVNSTPQYTTAGTNSIAGWYGTADNDVYPTNVSAYLGSSGDSSLSNLPLSNTTNNVAGGLGIGICDASTGEAVQVGDIYVGSGKMDVVAASGNFGTAINNNDACQNGVVNPTATNSTSTVTPSVNTTEFSYTPGSANLVVTSGNTPAPGTMVTIPSGTIQTDVYSYLNTIGDSAHHLYVKSVSGDTFTLSTTVNGSAVVIPATTPAQSTLPAGTIPTINWKSVSFSQGQQFDTLLTGISVNDTVSVDLNLNKGYSHGPASGVVASAKDLSVNSPNDAHTFTLPADTTFNEVDAGVVSDTVSSATLSNAVVPAANGGTLESSAPSELARVAHFDLTANVLNAHESHGAAGAPLASSADFVGSPVVSTVNGQPSNGNNVVLNTSAWAADNFYIQQGSLVG